MSRASRERRAPEKGEQMNASDVFFTIALICVGWGIVSAMNIVAYLSKRGVKIN